MDTSNIIASEELAAASKSTSPPGRGMRFHFGWAIVAAIAIFASIELYRYIAASDSLIAGALVGGSIAALATALGTLPVALSQKFSQRTTDSMLGFGAGVMLAACSFSLIIPGLDAAAAQGAGKWSAGGIVGGAILLGALLMLLVDRLIPHEHFVKGHEGPEALAIKRAWLFVFAIALHNFPEGLAIGVAYAGTDAIGAQALATGIAIQDVPEGMVIALALHGIGYRRSFAVGLGVLSGLVEPIAAVIGAGIIGISANLLPWGLALAAGAMLFVISHEIIPESHRKGHEKFATAGLMIGFVLMMLLDTALG